MPPAPRSVLTERELRGPHRLRALRLLTSVLALRRTQAIQQAGDLGLDPCQRLLRLGIGGG